MTTPTVYAPTPRLPKSSPDRLLKIQKRHLPLLPSRMSSGAPVAFQMLHRFPSRLLWFACTGRPRGSLQSAIFNGSARQPASWPLQCVDVTASHASKTADSKSAVEAPHAACRAAQTAPGSQTWAHEGAITSSHGRSLPSNLRFSTNNCGHNKRLPQHCVETSLCPIKFRLPTSFGAHLVHCADIKPHHR